MKRKLLTTSSIFLISLTSHAGQYDRAIDQTVKAVLKTGPVTKARKQITKYVKKKLPLTKTQMTALGVVSQGVISGNLNTRKLKNFGFKIGERGRLRIDAEYNWRSNNVGTTLNLSLPF